MPMEAQHKSLLLSFFVKVIVANIKMCCMNAHNAASNTYTEFNIA